MFPYGHVWNDPRKSIKNHIHLHHELASHEQISIVESLTPAWWFLELLPFRRLTFTWDGRKKTTRKPHLGSSRKIHEGQKIHSSLLLAESDSGYGENNSQSDKEASSPGAKPRRKYTPQARLPPFSGVDSFWETLRREGLTGATSCKWLELDLYESTTSIVEQLVNRDAVDAMLGRMRDIAISAEGRKALYTPVVKFLRFAVSFLSRVFEDDESVKRLRLNEIGHLSHLLWECDSKDVEKCNTVRDFVMKFTSPYLHVLGKHRKTVSFVAFSPDGKRMASGSWDHTICIWDAESWTILQGPLEGHTDFNAETGKVVAGPLKGHADVVLSVAFSPDGSYVVSGSADETVRIWGAETGMPVGDPLGGHTNWVISVAFLPDSKRIVSGSEDRSIRTWDAETGNAIIIHRIVSGSDNETIWILEYVASGSYDETIRLWDAKTGKQIGESLRGHTSDVYSVAFSPDGKRLASGSRDSTVRIWDVETWVKVACLS
ncbi:unnamed protein product [Cyclocybe aegerita]|uniref:WD40 repeat-like protein n=1 Tax=Cyclocybe aegerita TaxID=1973307 RepID=A0A8S0VUS8_CYCAE|nr:unnamed protein product [Cyclocybe aegerita]